MSGQWSSPGLISTIRGWFGLQLAPEPSYTNPHKLRITSTEPVAMRAFATSFGRRRTVPSTATTYSIRACCAASWPSGKLSGSEVICKLQDNEVLYRIQLSLSFIDHLRVSNRSIVYYVHHKSSLKRGQQCPHTTNLRSSIHTSARD